jgi:hypothetical protein
MHRRHSVRPWYHLRGENSKVHDQKVYEMMMMTDAVPSGSRFSRPQQCFRRARVGGNQYRLPFGHFFWQYIQVIM